jgi:hypothetical protein
MQVNLNNFVGQIARTDVKPKTPPESKAVLDRADFNSAADLNRSLQNLPDVRVEEVDRASKLVQDVNYPPPYAMLRIARLLAINLDSASE